ncbi:hypothetical protein L218DRAFT_731914 [Marasmius fiardii PR-910]|nr:hypothetical protein L218DRAFT_731914 [Marasmius fiardii PR-910]
MSDVRTCSRPIQSCFQCRKRKIKCNREYPCAPCILRGESEVCREVDRSAASSGKSTIETLDDVVNRIAVLEKMVSRLSKFLPPDLLFSLTPEPSASAAAATKPVVDGSSSIEKLPTPFTPFIGKSSPPTKEEGDIAGLHILSGSTSSDEEIAVMLEDFAMGNRINRHRAALELLDSTTSMNRDSWAAAAAAAPGSFQTGPLSLLVDSSANVLQRLISILPDETRSRGLIQFYFDRIEWYTKIFHYPSFMAEANEVFQQINCHLRSGSYRVNNDNHCSGSDPVRSSSSFGHISLPFLSTMFIVICLALHLVEPEICQKFDIASEEAATMSKKMYSAAQICLWMDDFWSNHSLEGVQCLLLMGVYQKSLDDADSHWALLGSAIKIAQNLGLSHLGSETDHRAYSGSWKSIVKREIARRVWWNLIFNDWSHAAAHGGVYSVHPSQNFTGLPANINDSDLVEGRELPRDDHQYTEMTFSLTRFEFVEIYPEIIDNNANASGLRSHGSSQTFIAETDARLGDMLERIPSRFQHGEQSIRHYPVKRETMGVLEMETLLALVMGETRRMRLHRPYLHRGYTDRKYARCTEQCVRSARAILHYLKSTPEQSVVFLRWWLVMFYGFGAAVVLFIDLCHLKAKNLAAVESRRVELREALNLFKITQNASTVSQNAIALLEGMLAVCEPRSSKKRRAEFHSPMERIAKRIMVESQASRSNTIAVPSIDDNPGTVGGACDPTLKTECCLSFDHGQTIGTGRSLGPDFQPHLDVTCVDQWDRRSLISPSTNDWHGFGGIEQGSQGMIFGSEFDDATAIDELGQLFWTAESSSGGTTSVPFQNPKLNVPVYGTGHGTGVWVHHNQNSY